MELHLNKRKKPTEESAKVRNNMAARFILKVARSYLRSRIF